MWEIFAYDFVMRAFFVGTMTAIAAAIVGNFIVAARQSIISDMLAHASLGGVGIGLLLDVSPIVSASFAAIFFSFLLWYMKQKRSRAPEALSMLLLTGGLAVALLCAHIVKDNSISFDTYLFGSILTVGSGEIVYYACAIMIICAVMSVLWRPLLVHVFDPQFARVHSPVARVSEVIFMIMIGILVALSLKVIGGLLIGALFVIPVLCAQNHAQSFRSNVYYSMGYGIMGVWVGIIISFYWDVPTSSGIVLSLIALFIISSIIRRN